MITSQLQTFPGSLGSVMKLYFQEQNVSQLKFYVLYYTKLKTYSQIIFCCPHMKNSNIYNLLLLLMITVVNTSFYSLRKVFLYSSSVYCLCVAFIFFVTLLITNIQLNYLQWLFEICLRNLVMVRGLNSTQCKISFQKHSTVTIP